jgi:uncharacterized membrane protein YphA (DoxX/SURF4 family)
MWKGLNLFLDDAIMESLASSNNAAMAESDAIFLLVAASITLLSGFLISNGLFTSIASLVQLPVVLLGVLFIHGGHIERNGFDLSLTVIVVFLLLFFISNKGNSASNSEHHAASSRDFKKRMENAYH